MSENGSGLSAADVAAVVDNRNGYGYGGYGGYGYNNYYNYMMMAQYASASATQTSISTELDKDRYYNCHLLGPGSDSGRRPKLKITYAIPKE